MSESFSAPSVARQLDFCTYCPKMCRHACPVANASGRETLIPQAKMDRLNQIRLGRASWSFDSSEPIWACTGCRQCTAYCEHENEPGLVLLAGRAEAQRLGVGHPKLANYPDRFRNRDERLAKKLREIVDPTRLSDDATVGYWPGCDSIDKNAEDIAETLKLFDNSWALPSASTSTPPKKDGDQHVNVVAAGQACAGYPLLAAGYPDMFRWHAAKVARSLSRFKTVVVNCSACVYAMRAMYPAEGVKLAPEVLALPEYLAQSATRMPQVENRPRVYYHDPCYSARYTDVVDAPRRLLAQVADVHEFTWSGVDTECCGGAGLLPKTNPEIADSMARKRLAEIANHGGGIVVTSCGTCSFMLRQNAPAGVRVLDLSRALVELSAAQD